jgi:hypothetical protein
MRQPVLEHVLAPALDVFGIQWLELEPAEPALDMMCVDRDHRRDIILGRWANSDVAHLLEHVVRPMNSDGGWRHVASEWLPPAYDSLMSALSGSGR